MIARSNSEGGAKLDATPTLEALRAAISQGLTSGPGRPAETVFRRLERKYRNHQRHR